MRQPNVCFPVCVAGGNWSIGFVGELSLFQQHKKMQMLIGRFCFLEC